LQKSIHHKGELHQKISQETPNWVIDTC
jgi:hypothetical protein